MCIRDREERGWDETEGARKGGEGMEWKRKRGNRKTPNFELGTGLSAKDPYRYASIVDGLNIAPVAINNSCQGCGLGY